LTLNLDQLRQDMGHGESLQNAERCPAQPTIQFIPKRKSHYLPRLAIAAAASHLKRDILRSPDVQVLDSAGILMISIMASTWQARM
jgi:hypothetical protein